MRTVSEEFDLSVDEIYQSKKGRGSKNIARNVAMYLCQKAGSYRLSDIARSFSLAHYGSVSYAICNVKKEMAGNQYLLDKIHVINNRLDP